MTFFTKKNILLLMLGMFIIMQFIRIDKTNPPVQAANDFVQMANAPQGVGIAFKDGCYDCHSNETKYPWYTNIAPLSFWVKGHIRNGRKKLNFSEWASYPADKQKHKIAECIEEIEEKTMPLKSYTYLHPKSNWSPAQKKELIAWLKGLGG